MGKDLLDDAYGRFQEIPLALARAGHEVHGLCASYRPRPEGERVVGERGAAVSWRALNVPAVSPRALLAWISRAGKMATELRPDVIWACSDSFHAALGARLERRLGIPCVVDLYDNFESYGANRIPGVTPLLKRAVRAAAGVTCVSGALERLVRQRYGRDGPTLVLENGVSSDFAPQDRLACRARFRLPPEARIVGTAGALGAERDIETLFAAFHGLAARDAGLYLLLAGRVLGGTRIPAHPRIVYLGERPLRDVPMVIGAMDVCVVCNKRSTFGDYCFPQKLYEIVACGVPPLVADTGGVAPLLAATPANRYEPESAASLAAGIERLLRSPAMPAFKARGWAEHAASLSAFFERVRAAHLSGA